tara:strand:+ start:7560 stop:7853 length:294 start_codon:yes stop_codon:yes gene_type:complete
MKNSNVLNELKDFDLITFEGSCVSWSKSLWTVGRITEKAILIDDEWLPKSQIVSISMIEKNKYDADGNFKKVIVPELCINKWFDDMNDKKRGKSYGY